MPLILSRWNADAVEDMYGVGRTETDTIKLRRLYDEGCRIAEEQMGVLREYLAR